MFDDLSDEFDANEDLFDLDEDETEEIASLEDKFYIPLSRVPKLLERFSLAFSVPDDLPPVMIEGFTLAWTKEALEIFVEILKTSDEHLNIKNLPYASLRGLLEVGLDNAARIQPNLELSKYTLNSNNYNKYPPEPFAYINNKINGGTSEEIITAIRTTNSSR